MFTSIKFDDRLRYFRDVNCFSAAVGISVRKFSDMSNSSTLSAPGDNFMIVTTGENKCDN